MTAHTVPRPTPSALTRYQRELDRLRSLSLESFGELKIPTLSIPVDLQVVPGL